MSPEQFKAARRDLGLSQNALAARMGVVRKTVQRWEKGTVPIPLRTVLVMRQFAAETIPV